jgi:hypothetical protein
MRQGTIALKTLTLFFQKAYTPSMQKKDFSLIKFDEHLTNSSHTHFSKISISKKVSHLSELIQRFWG